MPRRTKPEAPPKKRTLVECGICFEVGKVRDCCGGPLCDHCYTSRGRCPLCGVGIFRGKPVAAPKEEEEEEEGPSMMQRLRQEAKEEVLECRICLDPGTKRKCCGGCFCDACYFQKPTCPVCRKPNATRGIFEFELGDPGTWPVLLSGFLALSLIGLLLGLVMLLIILQNAELETVHGFTCYGIFPKCDRRACVEIDPDEMAFPEMTRWRSCQVETTEAFVRGSTCIYDWDLWVQSGHVFGYDFCDDSAKSQRSQVDGDESKDASFSEGAYIFEDTFEFWQNSSHKSNLKRSSPWAYVDGAAANDNCGAHSSATSLHFFGPTSREIVTRPLNILDGGYLNFRLKLAPSTTASDHPCRANNGAAVVVYYAVFDGDWIRLAELTAARYSNEKFLPVSLKLPHEAATNMTRIKISQPHHAIEFDHWAIDDVQVFRNFDPNWHSTDPFRQRRKSSRQDIHDAQCCFHTDQCEEEPKDCAKFRPFLSNGEEKRNYEAKIFRINGGDLYVSFAGLLALYSWLYWLLRTYLTQGLPSCTSKKVYVANDDDDDWDNTTMDDKKSDTDVNLKFDFKLRIDEDWQRRFLVATIPSLGGAILWALSTVTDDDVVYTPIRAWGSRFVGAIWIIPVPSLFVLALAIFLDLRVLATVAKDVMCLFPGSLPSVHLDLHPDRNCLNVGHIQGRLQLHVPLDRMEETSRFTKTEIVGAGILYILVCQPWATLTLCLDALHLPYATTDRYLIAIFGAVTCFRAFAGVDVFIKLALGLSFLFAKSHHHRNQVGQAIRHRRTSFIALYTCLLTSTAALLILPSDNSGHVQTRKLEVLAGLAFTFIFFILYALIVGCIQGIPATPFFKLTTLDEGIYFTYLATPSCPCESSCTDIHSRRVVIVLFVEDLMAFVARLKGDEQGVLPPST